MTAVVLPVMPVTIVDSCRTVITPMLVLRVVVAAIHSGNDYDRS